MRKVAKAGRMIVYENRVARQWLAGEVTHSRFAVQLNRISSPFCCDTKENEVFFTSGFFKSLLCVAEDKPGASKINYICTGQNIGLYELVDFVRSWSDKCDIPVSHFLPWIGIGISKFHDWKQRFGQVNEHSRASKPW